MCDNIKWTGYNRVEENNPGIERQTMHDLIYNGNKNVYIADIESTL